MISDIISHKKIISVYGLGNVGAPIAAAWLRAGAKVIGVDISSELLDQIRAGTSHTKEPFISQIFTKALKNGTLTITSDGKKASHDSHIKIVAVPVALKNNKIDLSALLAVAKKISYGLKRNDAVIICPSIPPGTTRKIIGPILEKSKLCVDKDFYLIYNPERIYEGRALQDIESNYPAIVSGFGQNSLKFAESLLKIISKKGVLSMSTLESAEAEKLFEGIYRDVNIALANELAVGANSQPYCHLHYPGTGVGGLCIPVYPQFIINASRKMNMHVKLTEFSRKINDRMPIKCVSDSLELLNKYHIKPKNAKIAVLGLAFRGEVVDTRLSPSYTVIDEFLKHGCKVMVHDPYIEYDANLPPSVKLSNNLQSVVQGASLIFISTDHKVYVKLNKASFSKTSKPLLIFDGRNILTKNNFKNTSIMTVGMR
ncbi:MAG: nucleotide sugar dehydrogenase [Nitrososphaeria archaeon]|nr:nucleotide sugar dehydrogenase [Nitrososphaeria archaeon]